MGWWWVPLLLASWLPGVQPCLLCFMPPLDRSRLCRDVTTAPVEHPLHQRCLEALVQAAVPFSSVTVASKPDPIPAPGAEQRDELRAIVRDNLQFLHLEKDTKPFNTSLKEAVDTIWAKLSKLEEAPACIPPCGYQPAARVYQCATCRLVDCQFPLDCPVQDVWAAAAEAITLHCHVPFAAPRDLPVTWMFAKDLRTQDLSVFEELQGGAEGPLSLTLQDPTPGTVACRLGALSEPLARKYFYLNVTARSVEAEQAVQAQLRAVLRWPQGSSSPHGRPGLGLGLALGSMALVLLLMATWQCQRHRDPSDPQTPPSPGQQGAPENSSSLTVP
ncbi:sperm acrosome membrane-associated protein 6 [Colius striatus]|uniref:sperm acrosome membrane-associated protein 6 n=1 Tax=Colius striatus TaxID=57412 RepID=UPI002B1E151D|nr:sperm acrosome membrane-associated protein 6 [Colius striatus]